MTIKFAVDENLHDGIRRGLLSRIPDLDIARVQDVGLSGADDPTVLEWAAKENRILLTHDVKTMTSYASARIEAGLAMPGIFLVSQNQPHGQVIEDLVLLAECSLVGEWDNQVLYIPL